MSLEEQELYEFGEFRLDVTEHFLARSGGERVRLSGKAFDTLCLLVRNAGHLVRKSELLDQIWGESFVEENNLNKCIHAVRRALGETPGKKFIETVQKQGYRFVVEVRVVHPENTTETSNTQNGAQSRTHGLPAVELALVPERIAQRSGAVVALADWRRNEIQQDGLGPVEVSEASDGEDVKIELPSTDTRRNPQRHQYVIAGTTSALALITLAAALTYWFTKSGPEAVRAALSESFSSQKLTTNGKVPFAMVSPDGKNVVYTNESNGTQSVWLRELGSGNNIEIIPPSADVYGGLAFSPDGSAFYFTRRPWDRRVGQTDIYRVSIFGGVPTRILYEVQAPISVSPDGKSISFVRFDFQNDDSYSLWIADTNGSGERKLTSRPRPARIGGPQISPDGKTVAFGVGQSVNGSNEFALAEVNIESGAERELTTQKFFNIRTISWLPDQSGLLISAVKAPNVNFRIWEVSARTGEAKQLTKDSENYSALRSDKSGDVMVAIETTKEFNLMLYSAERPSERRILADAETVNFAPSGKILYSSPMSGNGEIWSINADGKEQRQLTNNPAKEAEPISSPDGNWIFFVSNRTGSVQVWRMNSDGSNQIQITEKEGGYPKFVSPDGLWVYYLHGLHRTLWRVSTRGGEDEQLVLDKKKDLFCFSPDGLQVGYPEQQGGVKTVAIVSMADGQKLKAFEYAEQESAILQIEWLPDGKGLAYILASNESDLKTLWLQPLDAKTPQKIAELGDEVIHSLAVSPDVKSFAIVQGDWKNNAVLMRGLR